MDDKPHLTTTELISMSGYGLRGRIIQRLTEIEALMSIWLAEYFTSDLDKIDELVCLILAPRLTAEDKRQIFVYLIDKHVPTFGQRYKDYAKEIKDVIEERNIFAHYPIEFSRTSEEIYLKENSLVFVKLKNTRDREMEHDLINRMVYSQDKANKLLEKTRKIILYLNTLVNPERTSPPDEQPAYTPGTP